MDELTPYEKIIQEKMTTDQPMAVDFGYGDYSQVDVESKIGEQLIAYEELEQRLRDQLEIELSKASGTNSQVSTSLSNQLYNQLTKASGKLDKITQRLEAQLASQFGKAVELANAIMPEDEFIKGIMEVQPTATIPPPIGQPVGGTPGPGYRRICLDATVYRNWVATCVPSGLGDMVCPVAPPGVAITGRVFYKPLTAHSGLVSSVGGLGGNIQWEIGTNGFGVCSGDVPPYPPYPPPIPIPPPYPPPPVPPYQPPCPPPCPVIKFPDCIKICRDEDEKPCPEIEYNVYCDNESHVLYVIPKEDKPRKPSDQLLGSGKPGSIDWAGIVKQCVRIEEEKPPGIPEGGGWNVAPNEGCGGLFVGAIPQFNQIGDVGTNFLGSWFDLMLKAIRGSLTPAGQLETGLIETVKKLAIQLFNFGGEALQKYYMGMGCANPRLLGNVLSLTLLGAIDRYITGAAKPLATQIEYDLYNHCPYLIPNPEQATQAYLANTIDEDRLACIVRANGQQWEPWKAIVESNRTRLGALDATILWRRKFIDEATLHNHYRQLGYLYPIEWAGMQKLSEQVPVVSDLTTMMLRDVEDDINIDWSESDAIFKDKWKGQLKEWGDMQGLPELMMKYIWRAHWHIPSPTQLFEFWHRLRYSGKFGTKDQFYTKIKNALIQQDILPQWIDAYLEVSFKPLGRIDARRAFEVGTLNEIQLKDAFISQGYSDENSATMTEYTVRQTIEKFGRGPLVNRYVTGEVTAIELDQELREKGLSSEIVSAIFKTANRRLKQKKRAVCVKAIHKRYLLGEYDLDGVIGELQQQDLQAPQIDDMISSWNCELSAKGKNLPATTLCQWYELGILDNVEFWDRLRKIGYSDDQATRIMSACQIRLERRLAAGERKRIAQLKREQLAREREERRLAREMMRDQEKAAQFGATRRKVGERRQRLLIEAAEKYSQRTGLLLPDSAIGIKRAVTSAIAGGLGTIDTVYAAAVHAADDPECENFDCFTRLLANLLYTSSVPILVEDIIQPPP